VGKDVTREVTVVVPTIPGREELLVRALRSVEAQTWKPRVIVIHDDDRRGAAWARNEGLAQVTTPWIAWLDDDDELLLNHVEVLLRAAKKHNADLVYSYPRFVNYVDPLAVSVNGAWVSPFGVPFGPEQEAHLRTQGNFIPVTYLVRTRLARAVGGMPEGGTFLVAPTVGASAECEDYGFLLRLLDVGARLHHEPKMTWRYHVWGGNVGGRGAEREAVWLSKKVHDDAAQR
jgi:hypothetical protein